MDRFSAGKNTWGSARGDLLFWEVIAVFAVLYPTVHHPMSNFYLCGGVSGTGVGALDGGQKLNI